MHHSCGWTYVPTPGCKLTTRKSSFSAASVSVSFSSAKLLALYADSFGARNGTCIDPALIEMGVALALSVGKRLLATLKLPLTLICNALSACGQRLALMDSTYLEGCPPLFSVCFDDLSILGYVAYIGHQDIHLRISSAASRTVAASVTSVAWTAILVPGFSLSMSFLVSSSLSLRRPRIAFLAAPA